uniref:Potassium channel subfamily K member 4 n=1 Tax=Denticeps clupeoides TaxID=299321 RepID=A0AAY4CPS7_9TELE
MRCSTLLAILTVVLLYLVMGALVFRTLEASKERIKYDELLSARTSFLHNHTCVSPDALQELIQHVVSAIDSGVDASSSSNFTSRWDLSSAFFFCGTIITTIGFGNLSPKTEGGQLFCIFYALIGIPMFGILLAGVGDQLGTMLRRAVGKIETLFLRKGVKPTSVRIISAIFSILIGCLIFLGVPTLVFQEVEQWSLLEAGYFVVITLTTVGFGDYVADDRRHGSFMYKPIVWLWIVFGLAYFASILTMIGNWLRVLSKKTRAEMEELRAHATDWTQNIQNMSVDFRIPVQLDLNDPFQLQRRRRRRKRHRGTSHGYPKVAYVVPGLGESLEAEGIRINGHLFRSWSEAQSTLETMLETRSMPRLDAHFEVWPSSRTVSKSELRSSSRAASRSVSQYSSSTASGSQSESESQSERESRQSAEQEPSELNQLPAVKVEDTTPHPSLLDFFGENLAYIDESSDTLSDRVKPDSTSPHPPRKPKRRSMRRQLPNRSLLVMKRVYSSELQPPSNPPTPPPQVPS